MSSNLQKTALTKSLMLTVLLWVATALPMSYFKMYTASLDNLIHIMVISLSVLMLTVMPISYFALLYNHRCPKCKALWSYSRRENRVLEKGYNNTDKGVPVHFEKVLQEKKCAACGYAKLTPETIIIKEII